jgi:hypothetical protein
LGIEAKKLLLAFSWAILCLSLFSGTELFAAADDGVGSDCRGTESASQRKMEEEREREEERRRESYPDKTREEDIFEKCLGGIYGGVSTPPGFPGIPDLEDITDELCAIARREIGNAAAVPGKGFALGRAPMTNSVLPWTGALREDIWNALWW